MDFVNPFKHKKPGEEVTEQELISAIRLALSAEEEAVHLYDTIAEYAREEKVQKLMKDIASEEQVHIGELQELLKQLQENEEEQLQQGGEEAKQKLSGEQPADEKPADEKPESDDVEQIASAMDEE